MAFLAHLNIEEIILVCEIFCLIIYSGKTSSETKENIDKLSVINALCAPPNQHQINVNAWLPPLPEMDKLATHGIPRVVHVKYRHSAYTGLI